MMKKRAITIAAVLTASMAMSVTAFGATTDMQANLAQSTINQVMDNVDGAVLPANMITRALPINSAFIDLVGDLNSFLMGVK